MICEDCGVGWNEFEEGRTCWYCGVEQSKPMPPPAWRQMFTAAEKAKEHGGERGGQ